LIIHPPIFASLKDIVVKLIIVFSIDIAREPKNRELGVFQSPELLCLKEDRGPRTRFQYFVCDGFEIEPLGLSCCEYEDAGQLGWLQVF
jgi:hypothetical protein